MLTPHLKAVNESKGLVVVSGLSIQSVSQGVEFRNCFQNSLGHPPLPEDLSAFGNYSSDSGRRSLLLITFTNYVFNLVSKELIHGRWAEEGGVEAFKASPHI